MRIQDLGLIPYRDAWKIQEELHAQVFDGVEEALLLLEHTPVITLGRRAADSQKNLLAAADVLAKLGVDLVESNRGGDITFHGPGQLVAYPIVRLVDHRLSVGGYVQALQDVVIATLADLAINARKDSDAIGIWVDDAKICALGVRIKRGVSMHGIALNLTTDLNYFNLINPCGLNRPATSIARLLADRAPTMEQLKASLSHHFLARFTSQVR